MWDPMAEERGRVGVLSTPPPSWSPLLAPQSQGSAHRTPRFHPLRPPALLQGGATSWGAGSGLGRPARPPGATCSVPTVSHCPGGKGEVTEPRGQAGSILAPPGIPTTPGSGLTFMFSGSARRISLTEHFLNIPLYRNASLQEFPGGPVVRTPHSHCKGHEFHPLARAPRSLHATCTHTHWRSVVSDSFNPTDYSPPGSSAHGILQARRLECLGTPSSSRGSSPPRDRTSISYVSYTGRWVLYH